MASIEASSSSVLADPFDAVKTEVESAMSSANVLMDRWIQLTFSSNKDDLEEKEWTQNELKSTLVQIDWDLQDLEETIRVVENDRSKYKIDNSKLSERIDFCESCKDRVREIRHELLIRGNKKVENEVKKMNRIDEIVETDNNDFISSQLSKQDLMKREQDTQLNNLSGHISRISNISLSIHDELDHQALLIEELSDGISDTRHRMKKVLKGISKILKSKNRGQISLISLLLLIIIVWLIIKIVKS